MKKLLMLAVLAILVTACGGDTTTDDQTNFRAPRGGQVDWEAYDVAMSVWWNPSPELDSRELMREMGRIHCEYKTLVTPLEAMESSWNSARSIAGSTTSEEFSNLIKFEHENMTAADLYLCPNVAYTNGMTGLWQEDGTSSE